MKKALKYGLVFVTGWFSAYYFHISQVASREMRK